MNTYTIGNKLPSATLKCDTMTVITANVATSDFFPGLIDPDYARDVGHDTVFMNTMTLQSLMNRYVLDWAPEGRISWHEISMRKPAYAGIALEISGEISAVNDYPGSSLTGPGTEIEVSITIVGDGALRTVGKVAVVVPA